MSGEFLVSPTRQRGIRVNPSLARRANMTRSILVIVTMLLAAGPVAATSPPIGDVDESITIFQSLFDYRGVKPVKQLPENAKNAIVVVYQTRDDISLATKRTVAKALENGGSVLIVTDGKQSVGTLGPEPPFPPSPKHDISGCFPRARPDDVQIDKDFVVERDIDAPKRAIPVGDQQASESEWFGGLQRVDIDQFGSQLMIQNWPRHLRRVVATRSDNKQATLAAAGVGPRDNPFRCGVIVDTRIFANYRIITSARPEPDRTDNFRFAFQTVLWLQGPENRKECLFLVNGEPVTKFDHVDWDKASQPPIPTPPMPPLPSLLDRKVQQTIAEMVDGSLAQLEDNHPLDKAFGGRNDRAFSRFLAVLAILSGTALSWLMLRYAWQSRHRPEFQPVTADPLLLGDDVAIGSFEHRRLELVRADDLLSPVREYLRNLFFERGLPASVTGGPLPMLEITSRNRGEMKQVLRTLWGVAFGETVRTLSYSRWKELEPTIAMARSAADAELWRVMPAGSTA